LRKSPSSPVSHAGRSSRIACRTPSTVAWSTPFGFSSDLPNEGARLSMKMQPFSRSVP
jgi:hypothetical protein